MMQFCRYYRGEEENPFAYGYGPKYAKAFWRLEHAWVDGYHPIILWRYGFIRLIRLSAWPNKIRVIC